MASRARAYAPKQKPKKKPEPESEPEPEPEPRRVKTATGVIPCAVATTRDKEEKIVVDRALKKAWQRYDEAAVYWILDLLDALQPDWKPNWHGGRWLLTCTELWVKLNKEDGGHWSAQCIHFNSSYTDEGGWTEDVDEIDIEVTDTVRVVFPHGDDKKLTQFEPHALDTWVAYRMVLPDGWIPPRSKPYGVEDLSALELKTSGGAILDLDDVKTLEDFAREILREKFRASRKPTPTLEGLIISVFRNFRGEEAFTPAEPGRVMEMFCRLAVTAGPVKIKQMLKNVDNALWRKKKKHAYLGQLFKSLTAPLRWTLWSMGAGQELDEQQFSADLDSQIAAGFYYSYVVSERKRLADSDAGKQRLQKRARAAAAEEEGSNQEA